MLAVALAGCSADHAASYEQAPAPSVEDQVREFLQNYRVNGAPLGRDARFHLGTADLDGDGRDEALAWIDDRGSCGSGGCSLLVLRRDGNGWREVVRTTVTWPPVLVLESSANGWRDLAVKVAGGGVPAHNVELSYDGRSYPKNPTAPPARAAEPQMPGRVVIAGDRPVAVFPDG